MQGAISVDDARADDVRKLLAAHLAFANEHSPPEDVHALDVGDLLDPSVTVFSFRLNGQLLGVGALKRLDPHHAELKSMHTDATSRRRGVGRAMVEHVIGVARGRGFQRLSLETGTMAAFEPAHSLYARAGFVPCAPFGTYVPRPNSTCMTLVLARSARAMV